MRPDAEEPGTEGDDGAAETPPVVPVLNRFCQRCGALLDAVTQQCLACVKTSESPVRPLASREHPLRSALGLYFAFLATLVIVVAGKQRVEALMLASGLSSLVVLVWCFACRRQVLPLFRLPTWGWLAAAPVLGLVTFGLAKLSLYVLTKYAGVIELQYAPRFYAGGYGTGVVILLICVQPAIIEELAFRGVIFGGLGRVLSQSETVIVSALMFMVIHLSPVSFPHLFALGLILGWLRARSGSLYPCMILHFVHNLFCIAMELSRR